jgi:hopanoid biosynthesis associated RND transporter like protein HpnN
MTSSEDAEGRGPNSFRRLSTELGQFWSLGGRLASFSVRHAGPVVVAGLLLGVVSAWFAATHFAMSTDTDQLISRTLPWRLNNAAFNKVFPFPGKIVVVIDAQTPELAEQAAQGITDRLQSRPKLFPQVLRPDGGTFWRQNGLLFESTKDVSDQMAQLIKAEPFLGSLAADPSLRGVATTLSTLATGVTSGSASLSDLDQPSKQLATSLEALEAGKPAFFSWRTLVSGGKANPDELRQLILVSPTLDFGKLEPGSDASTDIRATALSLHLDPAHGVRVRLTGAVPLQDEEFATLADRAPLIGSIAFLAILTMLWFAVRSPKTMAAILATTVVGLATAMAFGLLIFGRFNVISVAFIPLFVGLGIDFGIQLSVRFRAEQLSGKDVPGALTAAGRGMGRSLMLAASAISAGFLAFGPTAYIGVSQLGVIAGLGLIFALILNLSLLPALLRLLEPAPPIHGAIPRPLRQLDGFMLGHRRLVVGAGVAAAVVCACLLPLLRFDFNPIHMRSPKVESVATLFDLMRDPNQSPNTLEVIAPSLSAAQDIARHVAQAPEVDSVRTLQTFIPSDQATKLAAIGDANTLLSLTLDPMMTQPPPTDDEMAASLAKAAADLRAAAGAAQSPAAINVRRLGAALDKLARGSPALRAQASEMLIPPLNTMLAQIRDSLQAQPVTMANLPAEVRTQWMTADGRARVSIIPKGDSNNNAVLSRFIDAVSALQPNLAGTPVGIREGGKTVVGAFVEAGVLSFVAITLLLFAILRRVRDVAITMAPIVLTGLLTLGSCVLIGQPLNFANIIALPLLFGIGVAFHIYFVMAWRSGGEHLLESSLTRAVFFSALTTATGFGSLWASSHPGTASMGKLLMISLLWTLVSALLFQPALMGPPPRDAAPAPA